MTEFVDARQLSAWEGLRLDHRVAGGHRNKVWRGWVDDVDVSIRASRRTTGSLEWELDLLEYLDGHGFNVPLAIPTDRGAKHNDGIVVQRWLEGDEPETAADWHSVAATLRDMHAATADYPQRPGCQSVTELDRFSTSVDANMSELPVETADEVLAVFAEFAGVATAVVHGDPGPSNIRMTGGAVGLLDFDESRVDVVWHDLSNLGVQVLPDDEHRRAQRLSNAWEAANAWTAEPGYAQKRLDALIAGV